VPKLRNREYSPLGELSPIPADERVSVREAHYESLNILAVFLLFFLFATKGLS